MSSLHPDEIRKILLGFWDSALEIASTKKGLSLAVPLCYPDGWQVVIDLNPLTPKAVRLSDGGKTLHWLVGSGQNIDTPAIHALFNEKIKAFEMVQDGWELYRDVAWPLDASQVQLFGEGLVALSYLNYLYEPMVKAANVARQTLEKVFHERKLEIRPNHRLDGRVEKKITVDYFVKPLRPVAFQVLGRRGPITGYMEQWGFRWRDLRDADPALLPAMIYDPDVQEIDGTALAIGEAVCELFCPYYETNKIHDLLDLAKRN